MLVIIIIILIAIVIVQFLLNRKESSKLIYNPNEDSKDIADNDIIDDIEDNSDKYTKLPYHKKMLLTKNEYYFFKKLKELTDKDNLQILAKIRLADLIEVNNGLSKSEWGTYFGKIKSKHIDFAIADNMKIVALIELDDSSHQKFDRVHRDIFVNAALNAAGYTVVRTNGDISYIQACINSYKNSRQQ